MKKIDNPWLNHPDYNCVGCAPNNPIGMHMEFYEDGDDVVSQWHPTQNHQGWLNTLHGGIQALLLDEICTWVICSKLGTTGVTSKMETRYKHHVATNEGAITVRARIREQRRNLVTVDAQLFDATGKLCTEAMCLYYTFPKDTTMQKMNDKDCITCSSAQ